jgi:hypothetical protein
VKGNFFLKNSKVNGTWAIHVECLSGFNACQDLMLAIWGFPNIKV